MDPYTLGSTILKVENISLKYSDKQILRNINLEIKDIIRPEITQGQIIGILSNSGNGKTQLLKIITGLIIPDTGTVMVGNPLKPIESGKIGLVAQDYPLFNHYTIRKNLKLAVNKNNKVLKKDKEKKINEVMDFFDLKSKLDKYPCQLSGGQKQRIAIAQQLLCSEHFLALDEPFSGLDPLMLKKTRDILLKISDLDELNTIILVTHDIHSALLLCDTLYILGHNDKNSSGTTIVRIYDLIDLGLAWHPELESNSKFIEIEKEITDLFQIL